MTHAWFLNVLLSLAILPSAAFAASDVASTRPQDELRPMLRVTWKKGPSLPQGLQDSAVGIIDDNLVLVGGFCAGRDANSVAGKSGKYPRGFLNKGWFCNLKDPQGLWSPLPDLPGIERQALAGAVAGNRLYCWGGLNYTAPFVYRDGFVLSHDSGTWSWDTRVPPLPRSAIWAGTCAIGSRIYVFGGADYDSERFYTHVDRAGGNRRLGAKLHVLDTRELGARWRELAECPGTPRMTPGFAVIHGKIYVFGGATGDDNPTSPASYNTVVDNWRYDPDMNCWTRLRDLPIASGNFFTVGEITFEERYVILVGGCQYPKVENPDGSLRRAYGKPTRHYPDNPYFSDVFVYDSATGLFGSADPLPLNNNTPMTIVHGNRIYLAGGETGGCTIEGETFGHHPDLLLVGTISRLNPRETTATNASGSLRDTGR